MSCRSTWSRAGGLLGFLAVLSVTGGHASCGGGGGSGSPAPGAPFGLTARAPLAPLAFPPSRPTPGALEKERAFPALAFSRPVLLSAAPDGSDRLYVVEQDGRILVFPNDDAVTSASVFLDLRAVVGGPVRRSHNEEGLLGLAFEPGYGTAHGRFYVHYSASGPRRSVLAGYEAAFPAGAAPIASAATRRVILEVAQPYGNHNGGMLAFGPDGMLYVALGDGGSGSDPHGHGQNLGTLLGALLRIDVRAPPPGRPFGVPPDNPFVGVPGAREEIWAYGLRNPWRFCFDRLTGDLWAGDVGQGAREEIDLVVRGGNHGWRIYEGTRSHVNPQGLPAAGFVAPVVEYGRATGTCIIGGCVYRGEDVPSLRGAYVYGDYGSGRVWALVHDGVQLVSNRQVQSVPSLASFGEDERGELYAVSLGGTIWRLRETGGGAPPPFPTTLGATGLFTDLASLTPARGLVEYTVNSPLWSDGAGKRRWIGLPGASQMVFDETASWTFPLGTVLVKHFELELDVGNAASARRLETRVLIREPEGWAGYTYRWNDAQSDALLLPDAFSEVFAVADPAAPGGVRNQTWTYPGPSECLQCHTEAAGRVLGARTGQLNRDFAYPDATDNQLRAWNHIGLFTTDVFAGAASAHERWPAPEDGAQPQADRARAYLAANCANCHQPGAPAPGSLDLRWGIPASSMGVVNVRPTEGDLGLPDAWIVRPGAKEQSVLWLRMRTLDGTRMPRLGSGVVHAAGVDLLGAWIDAGP